MLFRSEFSWTVDANDAPGSLYLSTQIDGSGWTIQYRCRGLPGVLLGNDDTGLLPDEEDLLLGGPTCWSNVPGRGIEVDHEKLDFKITADAGSRQGVISKLQVNIDVPDICESFDDIIISSDGTRLLITKKYRSIDYIGAITLQADGHGATGIRLGDKNAELGPLLYAVGASQATIDIYNLKGH